MPLARVCLLPNSFSIRPVPTACRIHGSNTGLASVGWPVPWPRITNLFESFRVPCFSTFPAYMTHLPTTVVLNVVFTGSPRFRDTRFRSNLFTLTSFFSFRYFAITCPVSHSYGTLAFLGGAPVYICLSKYSTLLLKDCLVEYITVPTTNNFVYPVQRYSLHETHIPQFVC